MAKKMNPKRPRNYAATDATLINIRKLRREVEAMSMELDALTARISNLEASQPTPAPEADADVPAVES